MPITIREILASDTISGAADKINFNFDQLLLNGGGPPGPPGPPGPIGPIGGRGIRGSVWYEGLGDPNLVPPTLTPEDEDNYLRGDGDVWTYNGNTWVNTTISLIGPVGPAGASGKFAEYQGQPGTYSTAGDTTMFPIPMLLPPAGSSTNTSNLGVRSVIIGGFPGGLVYPPNPMFPNTGDQIIVSSLATMIVQPQVSLFVHQFDSNGGGIKFHGGNVINDEFTNIITELTEIRLLRDDALYINVPKTATTPASVSEVDGIVVTTTHRGQLYQSGKRIQFQTGNSAVSYPFGDTSDFIVDAARNGSGSNPTIQLNVLGNTGAPTAAFRLGSTGTPGLSTQTGDARLGAGLITINGSISITGTSPLITLNGSTSITGTSPLITLNGTQQTNIYAGGTSLPAGVNGRVTIGASSQIVMRTINSASTGAISIGTGNGTTGDISITTGNTATGDISITTGNTATGDIVISTWVGNSGDVTVRAATDVIVQAGVDVDIFAANEVDVHSKDSDVHIYTNSGSGGDVLIDTNNAGSEIKIETAGNTSPIEFITNTANSPIVLDANNGGAIPANISQGGSFAYSLLRSQGNFYIGAGTGSYSFPAFFPSGNKIVLDAQDDVILQAANDIILKHGSGDEVLIQPTSGGPKVNLKPASGDDVSEINIYHNSAGGNTNLRLRSDATNGGEITVSTGMRLRLTSGVYSNLAAADEPGIVANGSNHYVHGTQITSLPNFGIISSGRFTVGITNATGTIIWHRVGNVVTGSGKLTATGTTASPILIPYPIKGSNNVVNASGIGTVNTTSIREVEAAATTFSIPGGALTSTDEFIFTFSYVIA